jgi:hypothetical protein
VTSTSQKNEYYGGKGGGTLNFYPHGKYVGTCGFGVICVIQLPLWWRVLKEKGFFKEYKRPKLPPEIGEEVYCICMTIVCRSFC